MKDDLFVDSNVFLNQRKYQLQTFDSKIVATALCHKCNILYSEDMQDGLVIEGRLKIVNPFK